MPINQINTSNTFFHWLTATQALIDKYNYFEIASNTVLTTANIVYATSNTLNSLANIVNSNTILVVSLSQDVNNKSTSVNAQTALVLSTSTNLMAYVNVAYATGNAVSNTVNSAFNHANGAYTHANAGFTWANNAYLWANSAYNKANTGYTHANASFNHANGAFTKANAAYIQANSAYDQANLATTYANNASLTSNNAYDRVNTVLLLANTANLVVIRDDRNTTTQYVVLTPNTSGLFTSANVASQSLRFNTLTGFLTTNLNSYTVNTGTLLVSNTGMVVGLNSQMLGGLTSSQYLRSDVDATYTGTLKINNALTNSIDQAGIWLYRSTGTLMFDTPAFKRFAWNDGDGNFSYKGGCLYDTVAANTVYYNSVDSGAVRIICNHESVNGTFSVYTGNVGANGANVVWTNVFSVDDRKDRVTINGNLIWHSGIDGAGSTLDADLLDGLQGNQFLRSDANTTLTGMLTITNNSATSNNYGALWLNSSNGALLFDDIGQKRISWNDGSGQFALRAGHRFFLSADRYINTGNGAARIVFTCDASNGSILLATAPVGTTNGAISWINTLEVSDLANVVNINGNKIWHAGNDGDGSTLDADLLDGQHGSYYAPINSPNFMGLFQANNVIFLKKGVADREGGEIVFEKPTGNTILSGNVIMDIYGNTLRVFDSSSTKGFTANLTQMGAGVTTTFQETLVSGTSIKTLNGETLLGAGDIELVPSKTVSIVSTNSTANVNYTYVLTSVLTLTLPSTANSGDEIAIVNLTGNTTSVLNRNGKNIMGISEDLTLDVVNTGFTLVYTDVTRGWVII